jgi:large subunit ribosomal protein L30
MAQVKITLIRSVIDRPEKQKRTMEALGIRRVHGSRVHKDSPELQGMLRVVRHLVKVEPAGE